MGGGSQYDKILRAHLLQECLGVVLLEKLHGVVGLNVEVAENVLKILSRGGQNLHPRKLRACRYSSSARCSVDAKLESFFTHLLPAVQELQ